ncbi:MAG: methyltransferase domain-containing protein [Gammaproteobacteria bacterium]|nr:methyltransferase domain-containing protein [Gammaproteobacteria bacterium]
MRTTILNSLLCLTLVILPFTAIQADQYDDLIQAALDEPGRLERNSTRDEARKPAEVIKFFGVQPGMTVLDVLATGGYYTEILAGVVGESGRVISHEMAAEGMDPDYYFAAHIRNSPHLDNVVPIYADLKDLDLKENSLDQIFLIQNFHDLWFDTYAVDPDKTLAVFRKALKPGGTLAVIDHVAEDSAPTSVGNSIHRISPTLTKQILSNAGFVFEAESDILLNMADDITKNVFAPDVRGNTSRFIHRYRNP